MGFAEAGTSIEEEGVIASAWCINDAFSGSYSELVVGSDDEIF